MAIQNLRSSSAHKRPIPNVLSAGQIAVNTNQASPGLFFKDSNGDLVKVGPVHIGTAAPNSSPATTAADALVSGTVYQILTLGNTDFTAVGASANTVGVVFTATGAGTGTGTVSGQQGNEKGEQWLDTTSGYDLKIYDGSAWRSQAGEFVNVTGDNMTGALGVVAGSASAPGVFFSGDTNTGLLAPAADSVAITTGGTQRMRIESSGYAKFNSGFVFVQSSASGSSDSDGLALISDTNADAYVWNYENTTLRFGTNATERLRIDSSGRLLVNTTTEGHSDADNLTIADSSKAGITIRNTITTGDGAIFFSDATSGTAEYAGYIEYGHSTNHLRFATASVEQMRIDSSGNVGIGNSAPAYKLSVLTTGTSDTSLHLATTGGASDNGDATNSIRFTGGNNTRWANAKYEAFAHIFNANGAEQLRIDSSGRLLVGTSSASKNADRLTGNKIASVGVGSGVYPSHVITGYTSGNNDAGPLIDLQKSRGSSDGSMTAVASSDRLGTLNFLGSDGTNFIRAADITAYVDGTPGTNDMPGRLVLATTADGASSPTERIRITSAGNVKLTFPDGNTGLRNKIAFTTEAPYQDETAYIAANRTASSFAPTDIVIATGTSAGVSEKCRVTSDGKLLVGTSSSLNTLGFAPNFQVEGTSAGTAAGSFLRTSSDENPAYLALSKKRGSGNVSSGDNIGRLSFTGFDGVNFLEAASINCSVDGAVNTQNDMPGRLVFSTTADGASSPTERMNIDSAGRIGIGELSPAAGLDVKVDTNPVLAIDRGSANTANFNLQYNGTIIGQLSAANGDFQISAAGASTPISFYANGSQRMVIDSNGNVGINESSPSSYANSGHQLVVSDASSACGMTIRTSSSHAGNIFFSDGTSGTQLAEGYMQYNHAGNYLAFGTLNTERMQINANGYSLFKGNASSYYNSTGSFHQFQQNTNSYVSIFNNAHSTPYGIFIKYDTTPNNTGSSFIECEDSSAGRFRVVSNGGIYNYSGNNSNLSDEREKKNIVSLDTKWDKVKSWDLKKFHYNDDADTDDLRYGVIAQQVETVCPEVLSDWEKQRAEDAVLDDEGNVVTPAKEQIIRKGVKEQQMMWMAIKALQEAQARIETLEAKVAALEAG